MLITLSGPPVPFHQPLHLSKNCTHQWEKQGFWYLYGALQHHELHLLATESNRKSSVNLDITCPNQHHESDMTVSTSNVRKSYSMMLKA